MINYRQRIWILTFIGSIIISGLLFRLVDLQLLKRHYYLAVAESQRKRASELTPNRGTIYLQESKSQELFPVAVNYKGWIAYAVPREMNNPLESAEKLAPALLAYRDRQQKRVTNIIKNTGQNIRSSDTEEHTEEFPNNNVAYDVNSDEVKKAMLVEELFSKFNQKTDPYEPILKFYEVIDEELKNFIEQNEIDGVVLEEQKIRSYPENSLAAHVLGFVGWKDQIQVGQYGIEGFFQEKLKGNFGFLQSERDATGKIIGAEDNNYSAAQDGSDLILTIDRVVQSIIEEELSNGVNKYGAERGSVIVMDPNTGAVLGMATYPSFDPNFYYAINQANVHINPVVSELFEPGSILKPIIMAAAIEEKKVTPNATYNDTGPVKVAEYTINTFDGKHHGVQTMVQILEQSNNVGMVWVGQQLGAELLYDFLRRFGIGEKTGIELEGETQNNLKEPNDWNVTTIATTSFGQGIALTPLQALNAINTIANGGLLQQPFLVSALQASNGNKQEIKPTTVRRVVSASTAADVSAMMVSVIENGVATLAKVPGFYMAGKTGTAQVPDENGKYSTDDKIITFAGFGPVTNPRFSILIKLDNPVGLSFASGTAAPMFRAISEKLLNYYQISPDYDVNINQPQYEVFN